MRLLPPSSSRLLNRVLRELNSDIFTTFTGAEASIRERSQAIFICIVVRACNFSGSSGFTVCVAQGGALCDLLRVQVQIKVLVLLATLSRLQFLPLSRAQLTDMVLRKFGQGLGSEVIR